MAVKHFYEQENYTNDYLIPYLDRHLDLLSNQQLRILEVGCAEGGSLAALIKQGFACEGVELEEGRAVIAKDKLKDLAHIHVGDITQKAHLKQLNGPYDVILMRDVIEHVDNKEAALKNLFSLLSDDGSLFIAYPLKYSPYAGHQQTAKSWLKYMLYILLYPSFLRAFLCNLVNDKERIDELDYLRKCALTYRGIKRLMSGNWEEVNVDFFISRPVYKQKFGWPIIKVPNFPVIREMASGCEILIKKAHRGAYID